MFTLIKYIKYGSSSSYDVVQILSIFIVRDGGSVGLATYKLKKSNGIHLTRHECTKAEGGRYSKHSTHSKPWSEIEVNVHLHAMAALFPVKETPGPAQ